MEDRHRDEQALGHADAERSGEKIEKRRFGGQLGGLESGECGLAPMGASRWFMDQPGFTQVSADGEARTERGQGALGDEADGAAAQTAELAVIQSEEIVALK